MQMFTGFEEVIGSVKVAYETVRRWREKSVKGTKSVRNAAKSDRSFTITGKQMPKIIKSNGRYTILLKLLVYRNRGCREPV